MNNFPALTCTQLTKTFSDGTLYTEVLRNLNLTITKGEKIAIIGPSGSGKSTLLHLLGGLEQPTQGEIFIEGENITLLKEPKLSRFRNHHLGFIYQFHHLLPEFSVLENTCIPLLIRGLSPQEARAKAFPLIEKVGLAKRYKHRLSELSGGERQRTAIARALINDPTCVLADEPTGNLDPHTAETVYETMLELNQEYKTSFIIATHDYKLASKMDRILKLCDGTLVD